MTSVMKCHVEAINPHVGRFGPKPAGASSGAPRLYPNWRGHHVLRLTSPRRVHRETNQHRQAPRRVGAENAIHGPRPAPCRRALDAEAVDINLVARMLERARENKAPDTEPDVRGDAVVVQGRFQRDPSEFASTTAQDR
jgi:hypothetical protein